MESLPPELVRRVAALASNRDAGASEILTQTMAILVEGRDRSLAMRELARMLCLAQPSMASVWNAALEALADEHAPGRFDRFAARVARASAALGRFGAELLAAGGAGPLRLVTLSLSRSVEVVFEAVRRQRPIHVGCSEGRPALEGRTCAARLAEAGVPVTCFSDAAIAHTLAGADAVVVGADAVGPEWFLNKSGTRMLAAAAVQQGVPVYVAATRDKFVGRAVGARLVIREGAPGEIWDTPPPGVDVRNPYFESTPLDLVTMVISDVGLLGIGMIPDVCTSAHDAAILRALDDMAG
jgi:ribose 1,5-bisphosphate isomerase